MISVITPTYNRATLLPRLYDSLKEQTYKDFEWIIVDDGSVDDTAAVVDGFRKDNALKIRYIHKDNGGKHTALNLGVGKAEGELVVFLDSDDSLPQDSLQTISDEYDKVRYVSDVAGVCGLMAHHDGTPIGSGFPFETDICSEFDVRFRHHVTGDLLEVFRTSVLREIPFPEIAGERFCPEQLCWFRIARKYRIHCFNHVVYLRDYLDGGLTDKIVKIRMLSPIASSMTYAEMLHYPIPLKQKVKAAINYWRFRLCAKSGDSRMPKAGMMWAWTLPLGWAMHQRDKRATRH